MNHARNLSPHLRAHLRMMERLKAERDAACHAFDMHREVCTLGCNGKSVEEVRAGFGCTVGRVRAEALTLANRLVSNGGVYSRAVKK